MKLFKDVRYKEPIKVTSCGGCPLEAKIPFKGDNGIVFHNKVCLGLNHRVWGTYGTELIHPSTKYAHNFGGFLPDCPLENEKIEINNVPFPFEGVAGGEDETL